jgi:serine/threonine-protein kinase
VTVIPERLAVALGDRYLIDRELGQGGMATVYLAEDVRHHRKVALKVLRPELAAVIGAERFLKEIEVTAHLQHPHILPLHDSGEADSFLFYVMPYVEGESLRSRLEREHQLSIGEAVELTRQVASALDYAHRHGVIHRDIKPENILIHDHQALIADFGIALAVSSASGTRMTETGMSLGTPHYMSPEQAMGDRTVDARSDVYALGCVLYEMLVGEPPFTGPTAQAIVAKVITEKAPPVTAARETAPAHLAAAIQKALAKLPADRFASAADFASALVDPSFTFVTTGPIPAAVAPHRRTTVLPWLLCLAGSGVAFWLGGRILRPAPIAHPVVRTMLTFSDAVRSRDGAGSPLAFSPDGARLAFLATDSGRTSRIYLRSLDRPEPTPVAGSEDAIAPFFSPNGEWLGFLQDGKLRKVSISGGAVTTIAELVNLQGASWGDDDRLVFSSRSRLFRVAASGGTFELLAAPDSSSQQSFRWPELLPGGRTIVFTLVREQQPFLAALSLADRKITELGQPGMHPHYVAAGFLVFAQTDGTVFAAPFDPKRVRFTGPPEPVADGVRTGPAFVGKLAVSRSGAIAYYSGGAGGGRDLIIMDNEGRVEALPLKPDRYAAPSFSPDGKQIAFALGYGGPPLFSDLWLWDIARKTSTRLTFDSASGAPTWSPDGRRIVYSRRMGGPNYGIFWIAPDGSGAWDTLLARPGVNVAGVLTPDGKRLIFQELEGAGFTTGGVSGNWNLWIAPVDSPAAARPLLRNRFNEQSAAISPDGQWLAYQSNETGTNAVYMRRLLEGGGRLRVSLGAGSSPQWSRDGRELFYRDGDSVFAVPIRTGAQPGIGAARTSFVLSSAIIEVDIRPDGRSLVAARSQIAQGGEIELVLNWFEQPRRNSKP